MGKKDSEKKDEEEEERKKEEKKEEKKKDDPKKPEKKDLSKKEDEKKESENSGGGGGGGDDSDDPSEDDSSFDSDDSDVPELVASYDEKDEKDEEEEEEKKVEIDEKEKKSKRSKLIDFKRESLLRTRMIDARPKRDEDKFADDGRIPYQVFRNKFRAVSDEEGINPTDVLSEIKNWLRGDPASIAEGYQEFEKPEVALRELWKDFNAFYGTQRLTAEERIKTIISKPEIAKLDPSAHMLFAAELRAALRTARQDGVRKEMDRSDIVKSVVTKRIPYLSESFYEKETKMRKRKPLFRMTLEHLITTVSDKAQSLKAQGIVSKPTRTQTAKVAAMETVGNKANQQRQNFPKTFSQLVADSPPKPQPSLPTKINCEFCNLGHHSKECPTFIKWTATEKYAEMYKRQMCYNCVAKGHRRQDCPQEASKCNVCSFNHLTCLHQEKEELRQRLNNQNNRNNQGRMNRRTNNYKQQDQGGQSNGNNLSDNNRDNVSDSQNAAKRPEEVDLTGSNKNDEQK